MENSITREEERLAGRDEGGDLAGSLEQSLREDTVGGAGTRTKRVSPTLQLCSSRVKSGSAQETLGRASDLKTLMWSRPEQ